MSTINAIGGSSAWLDPASMRAGPNQAIKDKLFARVDSDASGSVDKTELQDMLDHVAKKTGTSAANADDMLHTMDSDGNGSLSANELDAGLPGLLPPPSSTVEFAQRRSGDGDGVAGKLFAKLDADVSGGLDAGELNALLDQMASPSGAAGGPAGSAAAADAAVFGTLDKDSDGSISKAEFSAAVADGKGHRQHGGPDAVGGLPPGSGIAPAGVDTGAPASRGASASTSASAATDPLDSNGDGVVSPQERAAGELAELVKTLAKAAGGNGDGSLGPTQADGFTGRFETALKSALTALDGANASGSGPADADGSGGARRKLDLSALRKLVEDEYSRATANHEQPISTVNATA